MLRLASSALQLRAVTRSPDSTLPEPRERENQNPDAVRWFIYYIHTLWMCALLWFVNTELLYVCCHAHCLSVVSPSCVSGPLRSGLRALLENRNQACKELSLRVFFRDMLRKRRPRLHVAGV